MQTKTDTGAEMRPLEAAEIDATAGGLSLIVVVRAIMRLVASNGRPQT